MGAPALLDDCAAWHPAPHAASYAPPPCRRCPQAWARAACCCALQRTASPPASSPPLGGWHAAVLDTVDRGCPATTSSVAATALPACHGAPRVPRLLSRLAPLACSIDFKIKKVLIDGKWVKLQIWDTVRRARVASPWDSLSLQRGVRKGAWRELGGCRGCRFALFLLPSEASSSVTCLPALPSVSTRPAGGPRALPHHHQRCAQLGRCFPYLGRQAAETHAAWAESRTLQVARMQSLIAVSLPGAHPRCC